MTELGWLGAIVAENQGGLGLGAAGIAVICRELGRVVANEPFIESAIASATLLAESVDHTPALQALGPVKSALARQMMFGRR